MIPSRAAAATLVALAVLVVPSASKASALEAAPLATDQANAEPLDTVDESPIAVPTADAVASDMAASTQLVTDGSATGRGGATFVSATKTEQVQPAPTTTLSDGTQAPDAAASSEPAVPGYCPNVGPLPSDRTSSSTNAAQCLVSNFRTIALRDGVPDASSYQNLKVWTWWSITDGSNVIERGSLIKAGQSRGSLSAGGRYEERRRCSYVCVVSGQPVLETFTLPPFTQLRETWRETVTLTETNVLRLPAASLGLTTLPGLPGPADEIRFNAGAIRCDNNVWADNGDGADITRVSGTGCIMQGAFRPTVVFNSFETPKVAPVAEHVAESLRRRGLQREVLTRTTNRSTIAANRRVACSGFVGTTIDNSCDEYPMASTREGGTGATRKAVPLAANNSQGGVLTQFYKKNRVLDNDTFWVEARSALGPRISSSLDSATPANSYTNFSLRGLANSNEALSIWVKKQGAATFVRESSLDFRADPSGDFSRGLPYLNTWEYEYFVRGTKGDSQVGYLQAVQFTDPTDKPSDPHTYAAGTVLLMHGRGGTNRTVHLVFFNRDDHDTVDLRAAVPTDASGVWTYAYKINNNARVSCVDVATGWETCGGFNMYLP